MDLSANKTLIEIIKKGGFRGTHFRDTHSSTNGKWYKKSWKEFYQLKDIDAKYYASDYYDENVNRYIFKTEASLRLWENKDWIHEIDPYG